MKVTENPLSSVIGPVQGLQSPWDFVASQRRIWLDIRREARRLLRSRPAPAHQVLKPLHPRDCWFAYFVFAPDGVLSDSHRFTLQRLRDMNRGVLVVCAAPGADSVPKELFDLVDALYWKATSGYDFSAYTLALGAIADHSPGADVLVLNDSVVGPFTDLRPFIDRTPWGLTGFTASSLAENHLQSYAFVLRNVVPGLLQRLRSVFPPDIAFDDAGDVILCQELSFARVASRHMTVGACWYSVFERVPDPTLVKPLELLDAGFPFMKTSVLGKHSGFQAHAQEALQDRLKLAGHPPI